MHNISQLLSQWRLSGELLGFVVGRLFPDVQLIGGGTFSIGFYYDFIFQQPLTKEMIELIEVELHRFIKEDHPLKSHSMMRENAQTLFTHKGQAIFAERAGEEEDNIVELLQIKDFYTLCPHLPFSSTLDAGYVKLFDGEKRDEVTRLTGTSRSHAKELKTFLKSYEAYLKNRDHRMLGPKLKLFSIEESMGSVGVVWHPKGMILRKLIEDISEKIESTPSISTPMAVKNNLLPIDLQPIEPFYFEGDEYFLRPSFLKQHLNYIKNFSLVEEGPPMRVKETGNYFLDLSETERWGVLATVTNEGTHTTICCKKEQVIPELISSLLFIEQIITIFGFKAQWTLVVGKLKNQRESLQHKAFGWLREAFEKSGSLFPLVSEFDEDESEITRLELRVADALGRQWTVSEVGILTTSVENQRVVISRKGIISLDRLIGLLLEHYEGILPLKFAPEQVRVIAIGEANHRYAEEVTQSVLAEGWRVKIDLSGNTLGAKIHEAEKESVPYLLLLGEREREKKMISVRMGATKKFIDLKSFLRTLLMGENESA